MELNLIAEDTNQYGMDFPKTPGTEGRRSLAELLRELGKIEGLKWMRILYAYPSYFSEELIDEIATNPKVREDGARGPQVDDGLWGPQQHCPDSTVRRCIA